MWPLATACKVAVYAQKGIVTPLALRHEWASRPSVRSGLIALTVRRMLGSRNKRIACRNVALRDLEIAREMDASVTSSSAGLRSDCVEVSDQSRQLFRPGTVIFGKHLFQISEICRLH